MCISQEGEFAVLPTPYRKQQHAGPSALQLFSAAPYSEVESLAGFSQEMYYTFSGNDAVAGNSGRGHHFCKVQEVESK